MKSNCIFASDRVKCPCPPKWPLAPFICEQHLKGVYGLELWYQRFEEQLTTKVVGPFLIPTQKVYFPKNTVVFPDREFVDHTFLPDEAEMQADKFNFSMNPQIVKYYYMLAAPTQNKSTPESVVFNNRYQYEVIRNLSQDAKDVDLGTSNNPEQFINFKNTLQKNLSSVEHTIDNMPIYKSQFGKVEILESDNQAPVLLERFKTSRAYKFFLSHCMFDQHVTPTAAAGNISYVPFNVVYKRGIGFVTTEDIGNPFPLVVAGIETGSMVWLMNKVSVVDKDVRVKEISAKDIQGFVGLNHQLKGGSDNCLM